MVSDQYVNKRVRCPKCKEPFVVNSAEEEPVVHEVVEAESLPTPPARRRPMDVQEKSRSERPYAVTGVIVNLVIPGLGTIIAGEVGIGIIQLFVLLAAWFVAFGITLLKLIPIVGSLAGLLTWLPYVIWALDWIWALITGIMIVQKTK